jgi:nicotinamidase-related amidase
MRFARLDKHTKEEVDMKGLLLIDIQNDYFPGGAAELVNANTALRNAKKLLDSFRQRHLPVIHVQHINIRPGATFFLPGTEGVQIHKLLTPRDNECRVTKNYPNSFYRTNLLSYLKINGINELVISGMMTHMCVDTTVRAAKDHELSVTLISDACATKDLIFEGASVPATKVQAAFMAALSGLFAEVTTTSDFLKNC